MSIYLVLFLISWFGPSLAMALFLIKSDYKSGTDLTVKIIFCFIFIVVLGYISTRVYITQEFDKISFWFHEAVWGKFNDKILNRVIIHGKKEKVEDED